MTYDASTLKDSVQEPVEHKRTSDEALEHDIAHKQWQMYTRARDAGHTDWVKEAAKYDRFYFGDQWDAGDLSILQSQGRPALTINMIKSTVNVLLGEQTSRRVDMQFKPRRNSTLNSANTITKLAMAIADANMLDWVESTVFADGIIQDRGYFDWRMDFESNPAEPEAKVVALDPTEVIPDPQAKSYDPATWSEVYWTRKMSVDDIVATYGEEWKDRISAFAYNNDAFESDSITLNTFGDTENENGATVGCEEQRKFVKSARVVERQYYRNTRIYTLVDPATGDMRDLPTGWTRKEARIFAKKAGLELLPRTQKRVRWTVTCDRYVLHDDWSPYRTFTIVPYFPYFRRGRPAGAVRDLISPQEQVNKISSQELHIINTTANSGWIVERGSLANMTPDELKTHGSKTGVVIEVNPGRQSPEKIKPNTIPTGIERFGIKAQNYIKEISGVVDSLRGDVSPEVSGVALEESRQSGLIQVNVPMDSFAKSRHLNARKMLELIQDFYTEERMFSLTHDLEPGQPMEEMVINQDMGDGTVQNDVTLGDHDIVITTMPARDSFNDSQFAEAINLRRAGVMIPDHHVIMNSHLSKKHQIAEEVKQLSGMGEKSETEVATEQRMQELQIATLEAELNKLTAQAEELRSQAELNAAKAGDLSQGYDKEINKLEQRMQQAREEIQLRERLAELSAVNKLDLASMSQQKTQENPKNA